MNTRQLRIEKQNNEYTKSRSKTTAKSLETIVEMLERLQQDVDFIKEKLSKEDK